MAIVLDAATGAKSGGNSLTFSHTVGAALSNSLLVVAISVQDSNHANLPITGVTYAGVAMTKIRQDTSSTSNVSAAIYYLLSPTSGANNVVVSTTGSVWKAAVASSWSGVQQSSQPDAQAGKGTANQSSSSPSQAITTVANNALIVDAISSEAARTGLGSGQTSLGTQQGQSFENLSSSYEVKVTAGSETMSATLSSGQAYNYVVASFSPSAAAVTYPSYIGGGFF